jgi:hypothetical protein
VSEESVPAWRHLSADEYEEAVEARVAAGGFKSDAARLLDLLTLIDGAVHRHEDLPGVRFLMRRWRASHDAVSRLLRLASDPARQQWTATLKLKWTPPIPQGSGLARDEEHPENGRRTVGEQSENAAGRVKADNSGVGEHPENTRRTPGEHPENSHARKVSSKRHKSTPESRVHESRVDEERHPPTPPRASGRSEAPAPRGGAGPADQGVSAPPESDRAASRPAGQASKRGTVKATVAHEEPPISPERWSEIRTLAKRFNPPLLALDPTALRELLERRPDRFPTAELGHWIRAIDEERERRAREPEPEPAPVPSPIPEPSSAPPASDSKLEPVARIPEPPTAPELAPSLFPPSAPSEPRRPAHLPPRQDEENAAARRRAAEEIRRQREENDRVRESAPVPHGPGPEEIKRERDRLLEEAVDRIAAERPEDPSTIRALLEDSGWNPKRGEAVEADVVARLRKRAASRPPP